MGTIRLAPLALAVMVSSAAAQDSRPRVEFGALVAAEHATESIGLGARVGAFVNERSAFEAGFVWLDLGRNRYLTDQIVWIYSVQGRRTIRGSQWQGPSTFITYGATGFASRTSTPTEGFTLFYVPPFLPTGGVGWNYGSPGRVGARFDLQGVLWIGEGVGVLPRVSASLSFRVP